VTKSSKFNPNQSKGHVTRPAARQFANGSKNQRFLATALTTLDRSPFFGAEATFGLLVVVVDEVRAFGLGLRASAFGGVPKARLRTVVVGVPFAGLPGTVGVVGARRPNTEVVGAGTFVVDDD
jgi:hypothetical protein